MDALLAGILANLTGIHHSRRVAKCRSPPPRRGGEQVRNPIGWPGSGVDNVFNWGTKANWAGVHNPTLTAQIIKGQHSIGSRPAAG